MTQATQTATPTEAREASMSRVTTQETILAKLTPPEAAKEPPASETTQTEQVKDGEAKPKKTASERFQELANKRREAEAEAETAKRENAELKARLQALSANAQPMEAKAKPLRSQFATDDEYIESLSDWKAKEAIAERERAQAQARAEAEQAEIAATWSKRQDQAMKELPDYVDVIGKSEVSIPNHVHAALVESEMGPWIAYYLAMPENADEVKALREMRPMAALRRVNTLERELVELHAADAKPEVKEEKPPVQQSKAPKPIEPVRGVPSGSSAGSDFESYRARRQAQQAEQRK